MLLILKYLPDSYSASLRTEILKDIYAIEEDLKKHTEIEDKLLLPAISRLMNMSAEKTWTDEADVRSEPSSSLSEREKEVILSGKKQQVNISLKMLLGLRLFSLPRV